MMQDEALISLACMEAGFSGVVNDIRGGYGLLSCLKSLGITPGKRITRITPIPIQGPITVEMDKVQVVIGFGMAARILVKMEENVCNH
ncbi:MAG: FeoA family protein [Syntrophaceae bacterium]